jgi:hypothetical protein
MTVLRHRNEPQSLRVRRHWGARMLRLIVPMALTGYLVATWHPIFAKADETKPPFETCGLKYTSIPELERELAARLVALPNTGANYLAYSDEQAHIVWTFTRPGFTPYPAVVCRRIFQNNDGTIGLDMKINCFGTTPQCDHLNEQFQQLNDQTAKALKGTRQIGGKP